MPEIPPAPTSSAAGTLPDRRFRLARMTGRNPAEGHRAATPLELLFDLAFVAAFGTASAQLAHLVAEGHVWSALGGFGFAMFALGWAWINFSWFASAYDTDDWLFRVLTMVQMIGVVVLALGLPAMFHSIDEGHTIDNGVMVAGYIVMRVALVLQWLRAAKQDPERKVVSLGYVKFILIAQVGWVLVAVLHLELGLTLILGVVLWAIEMAGPVVAEGKGVKAGVGTTPWHAHHIAERYGLLTIIALGEGVFGTVASVSAVVTEQGWSTDAVILVIAGIGLTFGLWWCYFTVPSGTVLHHHRGRAFVWGYGHLFVFASIAAVGAGLHVAALVLEHEAHIGTVGAVLATAIPVLIFVLALFGLYTWLMHEGDGFHITLMLGSVAVLAVSVLAAALGASLSACLLILTLAPIVIIVGYEVLGHRHERETLARVLA